MIRWLHPLLARGGLANWIHHSSSLHKALHCQPVCGATVLVIKTILSWHPNTNTLPDHFLSLSFLPNIIGRLLRESFEDGKVPNKISLNGDGHRRTIVPKIVSSNPSISYLQPTSFNTTIVIVFGCLCKTEQVREGGKEWESVSEIYRVKVI